MGRTALLVVAAGVLAAAPVARAGGDFVDLAVGARVWFVGSGGVRSLDARTGRTLSSPQLVGGAYPLSVALAGGAAWVASVENGYVWGTLSRIDEQTGRVSVVWRRQGSSVQYVGAGAVWLPRARSVLRLDERTGRVRILATGPLRLGGFQHDLAAGDGALWALQYVSRARSKLVRYDPRTGRRTSSARL